MSSPPSFLRLSADRHGPSRTESPMSKHASAASVGGGHTHISVDTNHRPPSRSSSAASTRANSRLHQILHRDSSQGLKDQANSNDHSNSSTSLPSSLLRRDRDRDPDNVDRRSVMMRKIQQQQHQQQHYQQQTCSESTSSSPILSGSPAPSTPSSPVSTVKETHHINIDYDPVSGRKTLNTYEIVREIGRGQHGKVKLGRETHTGEYVAIKVVDRTGPRRFGRSAGSTQEEKIRREIAILKKCVHPNIVQLREVLDDSTSKKIYLVLEYVEKGEVVWQTENNLPAMTRAQARSTIRDVLLGLEYLHYQGIIHRDIKPANLLCAANGTVKISDFGVSYAAGSGQDELELAKTAGTPAFFAPEVCIPSSDSVRPRITDKIDIWALGVTLFCLIYGQVPFTADSEFELLSVIVNQPLIFPDEVTEQNVHNDGAMSSPPGSMSPKQSSIFYYPPSGATPQSQSLPVPTPPSSKKSSIGTNNSACISPIGQYRATDPMEPLRPVEMDADLELAKDLMRRMMEKDPEKRIDIPEIKTHPWICDGMDAVLLEKFLTRPQEIEDRIEVSGEEMRTAVQGISSRIKRGLSKFGSSALQLAGLRRRKSSASSSSSRLGSGSTSRSASREPPNTLSQRSQLSSRINMLSETESQAGSPGTTSRPTSMLPPSSTTTSKRRPLSGTSNEFAIMYDSPSNAPASGDHYRRPSSATSMLSSPGTSVASSAGTGPMPPPLGHPTGVDKRAISSSTFNFNLNALLEGDSDDHHLQAPAFSGYDSPPSPGTRVPDIEGEGIMPEKRYSTLKSPPKSSWSLSSDDESSSDDNDDNGELTLVLGPNRDLNSVSERGRPQTKGSTPTAAVSTTRGASVTIRNDDTNCNPSQGRTRGRSHSVTIAMLNRKKVV
uniref:non-specific serine/threonine protein kinase n=1 Tax=Blastobotrys adeninivorans TaxID=409370 RepID=A0A060T510_BLAAD